MVAIINIIEAFSFISSFTEDLTNRRKVGRSHYYSRKKKTTKDHPTLKFKSNKPLLWSGSGDDLYLLPYPRVPESEQG